MEPLPGDSPVNRFLSFWGAVGVFFLFGVLAVLAVLAGRSCSPGRPFTRAEEERRLQARLEAQAEQAKLVDADSWEVDEAKGRARVPVEVAMEKMLPLLQDRKAEKTDRPVPGTKPYEEMMARQAAEAQPSGTDSGATPAPGGDSSAPQPQPQQ